MTAHRHRRPRAPQGRFPRFITGKGRYVDDINRPGQTTPISCARRTRTRRSSASTLRAPTAAPGVVAIYTGDDIAADKVGGLICGWMIHSTRTARR